MMPTCRLVNIFFHCSWEMRKDGGVVVARRSPINGVVEKTKTSAMHIFYAITRVVRALAQMWLGFLIEGGDFFACN